MKTVYLIRHVEQDRSYIGDRPITENGKKDALRLSKILEIDKVYSSPLKRAIQTAEIIDDEYIIEDRLREREFGEGLACNWENFYKDENFANPGGETRLEVEKRMYSALVHILETEEEDNIALISHGAAISFLLLKWCKLEGFDMAEKKRTFSYKGEIIFDGSMTTPDIFMLKFNALNLVSLEWVPFYKKITDEKKMLENIGIYLKW